MEFDDILKERLKKTETVLAAKAREYATDDNRYHNFFRAAALQGCTPEQALMGMLSKHLVSVLDMVDATAAKNWEAWPGKRIIDEKIGDSINYLILLEALLTRRSRGA
jgi:hypothetical protein